MKKLLVIFLLCLPLFSWAIEEGEVKVLKKGRFMSEICI